MARKTIISSDLENYEKHLERIANIHDFITEIYVAALLCRYSIIFLIFTILSFYL